MKIHHLFILIGCVIISTVNSFAALDIGTHDLLNIGQENFLRDTSTLGINSFNTITGGLRNTNNANEGSMIGGGILNSIMDTNAVVSVIAGGYQNRIIGSHSSVIAGGRYNHILKTNGLSTRIKTFPIVQ
jgi:hypothetical protein